MAFVLQCLSFMKNINVILSVLTTTVLFGCGSFKASPGFTNPTFTVSNKPDTPEKQIQGAWKLETKDAVTASGIRAPRILILQTNTNQLNQADFCDLDTLNGNSGYEFHDGVFAISFSSFKDSAHPEAQELPTTEKKFIVKVSALDKTSLEFDGKIRYSRFDLPKNQGPLSDGYCKAQN